MIKRIVVVVGAIVALIGLSQLAAASWWVGFVSAVVNSFWMGFFGVVAILFGALMLVVVAEKLLMWRTFYLVVGLVSLLGGALMVLNPAMARDLMNALMLNRSDWYRVFVMWISGLVRFLVGAAIVYTVWKSPGGLSLRGTRAGDQ